MSKKLDYIVVVAVVVVFQRRSDFDDCSVAFDSLDLSVVVDDRTRFETRDDLEVLNLSEDTDHIRTKSRITPAKQIKLSEL